MVFVLDQDQGLESRAKDGLAFGLEPFLQHAGIDAAEIDVVTEVAVE